MRRKYKERMRREPTVDSKNQIESGAGRRYKRRGFVPKLIADGKRQRGTRASMRRTGGGGPACIMGRTKREMTID
jgi:hypothetical protein